MNTYINSSENEQESYIRSSIDVEGKGFRFLDFSSALLFSYILVMPNISNLIAIPTLIALIIGALSISFYITKIRMDSQSSFEYNRFRSFGLIDIYKKSIIFGAASLAFMTLISALNSFQKGNATYGTLVFFIFTSAEITRLLKEHRKPATDKYSY